MIRNCIAGHESPKHHLEMFIPGPDNSTWTSQKAYNVDVIPPSTYRPIDDILTYHIIAFTQQVHQIQKDGEWNSADEGFIPVHCVLQGSLKGSFEGGMIQIIYLIH